MVDTKDPSLVTLAAEVTAAIEKRDAAKARRAAEVKAARAEAEAEAEKRAAETEEARVYQLGFWPDEDRAMPGDFIACALFTACKSTEYVTRSQLASVNGLTVIFTGKRLTQVHADVWMGIMHLAREHFSGERIAFRERTLLELIGRYTHQRQREELKNWISQLAATQVLLQDDVKRKRQPWSLLPWHEEQDGDGYTLFVVDITRDLAKQLSGNYWCVDWGLRKRLQKKPLALWLQTYFARFKRPVSVATLHSLSGSAAKLKMFRFQLARALDELHLAGGFSAVIDRETDTVRAAQRPPPKPRKPAHEGQAVLPFPPLRLVK
jgi:hypothetical protein